MDPDCSGTMRLLPLEDCIPILRGDYEHMQKMLFGNKPTFEEIMDCIARLEQEINQL